MKIYERIHIVGSGDSGFSLTNPADCTVYLLECGSVCALIDSGSGLETERLEEQIYLSGHRPEEIAAVFLTHGHGDHAGGARGLSKLCKATVYGMADTARFVSKGDETALSIKAAVTAGIYEAGFVVPVCPVQPLGDGQEVQLGEYVITAHLTEGHCRGHGCFELRINDKCILFSGDSVFCDGKISLQAIWDCDLQAYFATVRKLGQLRPDLLLPAHGRFALSGGYRHISLAMDSIDRLGIPGNP